MLWQRGQDGRWRRGPHELDAEHAVGGDCRAGVWICLDCLAIWPGPVGSGEPPGTLQCCHQCLREKVAMVCIRPLESDAELAAAISACEEGGIGASLEHDAGHAIGIDVFSSGAVAVSACEEHAKVPNEIKKRDGGRQALQRPPENPGRELAMTAGRATQNSMT